jgi:hypothetical protein
MWNLKCVIMPVIIGATGIVTRSLWKNLEAVPGKHSIDSLQKTTWNITHNTESTAVWSLKPEWWGSPLIQEKYQEEKACDKRHPYCIIIIIIIIIMCHELGLIRLCRLHLMSSQVFQVVIHVYNWALFWHPVVFHSCYML